MLIRRLRFDDRGVKCVLKFDLIFLLSVVILQRLSEMLMTTLKYTELIIIRIMLKETQLMFTQCLRRKNRKDVNNRTNEN